MDSQKGCELGDDVADKLRQLMEKWDGCRLPLTICVSRESAKATPRTNLTCCSMFGEGGGARQLRCQVPTESAPDWKSTLKREFPPDGSRNIGFCDFVDRAIEGIGDGCLGTGAKPS